MTIDSRGRSSRNGASGSLKSACRAYKNAPGMVAHRSFPPDVVIEVKALAWEMPAKLGLPLSRLHSPDIRAEALVS